ncbi:hypothetical protein ACNPKB_16280 [Shewanella marisflavi]|uniref:hypothetical protein n=1 Tax=Shewanella marisflavi TaxID=260364 RepID=UPI003AAD2B14
MNNITCVHCKSSFKAKRKTAKFCSDRCTKAFKRNTVKSTRKSKPLNHCKSCGSLTKNKSFCNHDCQSTHTEKRHQQQALKCFHRTGFGKWLIYNCKRANTVQILTGSNFHSFNGLFTLYKRMVRANGYGKYREHLFELAHLAPVKGRDSIGLLSTANLLIASKEVNRSLSNDDYNHTSRIMVTGLQSRYKVYSDTSDTEILSLINGLTDGELFRFIKCKQITPHSRTVDSPKFGERPYDSVQVVSEEVTRLESDIGFSNFALQQELERIHYSYGLHFDMEMRQDVNWGFEPMCRKEANAIEVAILTNTLKSYQPYQLGSRPSLY